MESGITECHPNRHAASAGACPQSLHSFGSDVRCLGGLRSGSGGIGVSEKAHGSGCGSGPRRGDQLCGVPDPQRALRLVTEWMVDVERAANPPDDSGAGPRQNLHRPRFCNRSGHRGGSIGQPMVSGRWFAANEWLQGFARIVGRLRALSTAPRHRSLRSRGTARRESLAAAQIHNRHTIGSEWFDCGNQQSAVSRFPLVGCPTILFGA